MQLVPGTHDGAKDRDAGLLVGLLLTAIEMLPVVCCKTDS